MSGERTLRTTFVVAVNPRGLGGDAVTVLSYPHPCQTPEQLQELGRMVAAGEPIEIMLEAATVADIAALRVSGRS